MKPQGERIATDKPIAMTAIYNTHETAADAQAVLDHIPPNTLVFREGTITHQKLYIAEDYAQLAQQRLEEGAYTGKSKDLIDKIFLTRYNSENPLSWRSREYFATLFTGLIQRNCVIIPADQIDVDNVGILVEDAGWVYHDVARLVRGLTPKNLPMAVEGEVTHTDLVIEGNKLREDGAISQINEALHYLASHDARNLDTTADGQYVSYIIYGALHRHSLTRRLAAAGIPLSSVEFEIRGQDPDRLPDLARLEDTTADNRREMARTVFTRLLNS